jgi:NAD(P)H-hydrate epimerase
MASKQPRYLSAKEATELDKELMGTMGFISEQLMELAALSVATAVMAVFPKTTHSRVLVVCGPGNNGGDGLIAARHLVLFGYTPTVVYPKRVKKPPYEAYVTQVESMRIPILDALPDNFDDKIHLILDGIFGYSFAGDIRAPFDAIIKKLKESKLPIASIDIPSGWNVDEGNLNGIGLEPKLLISLGSPKQCAKFFKGQYHILGGRFTPPALEEKHHLNLPPYKGAEQIVWMSGSEYTFK